MNNSIFHLSISDSQLQKKNIYKIFITTLSFSLSICSYIYFLHKINDYDYSNFVDLLERNVIKFFLLKKKYINRKHMQQLIN